MSKLSGSQIDDSLAGSDLAGGPNPAASSRRRDRSLDREADRTLTSGDVRVSYFNCAPERIFVVEPRDGVAVGNILWVHGLTDHTARQFESAVGLAEQGYRVTLFDLQGHGGREMEIDRSWWLKRAYFEAREEPGAVSAHLRRLDRNDALLKSKIRNAQYSTLLRTTIDDHLRQFDRVITLLLDSRWGDLPLYLFGHSMGGLICVEATRRFGLRSRANLRGLILMAPAFQPIGRPNRRVENAFIDGFWTLSTRPSPFSIVRPAAKRVLNLNFPLDVSWGSQYVSDERDENQLIDDDPLCHETLPSAYVSSIESQLVHTNQTDFSYLPSTLVLVPQDDRIVNTAGTLSFAERARKAVGRNEFSLVRFPYLQAHNLLRSSVRTAARGVIVDWLAERSPPPNSDKKTRNAVSGDQRWSSQGQAAPASSPDRRNRDDGSAVAPPKPSHAGRSAGLPDRSPASLSAR